MKTYQNDKDFTQVYPFIPYQFNLLQKVFEGVRIHGASGKHISEGERSLLGAFQESAIRYRNEEIGALIPFSTFYQTIEAFLDNSINSVIKKASKNTRLNEYDVEVLKILFLLKYVNEVKSNLENLATLMVKHIDDDKIDIKKNIQTSLNKLIRETLVQKNGEEYVFLTNDEQDINKEISNINIEMSETINKVGEIVFAEIYKNNKFRYSAKKDFSFNKFIDSTPYGVANHEIGVRIITPYNDMDDMSVQDLRMLSARENNVIIKLSNDTTFLEEIEESLRIEKYMRLNSGSKSNSNIEAIKIRKAAEKNDRRERANLVLSDLIRSADIYVNNNTLDIKEKNPDDRINDSLKTLVDIVYSKLGYIKKNISTTREIGDILSLDSNKQITMDVTSEDVNKNAIDEINRFVERNSLGSSSTTVKSIMNNFIKAPFGWEELDIQAIIAKLFKDQKIKLELSGENLNTNNRDVLNYITKRDYVEKTKVKSRVGVPDNHIKSAKEISNIVFMRTITKFDEDGVMADFREISKDHLNYINILLEKCKLVRYPGKKILLEDKELIEEVLDYKDPVEFFKTIHSLKDDFEDYGDDVADVLSFFKEGNTQKRNFDIALERIKHAIENMTYLDEEAKNIIKSMQTIVDMESPYRKIHELPMIIEKYNDKLVDLYEKEAELVRPIIETHRKEVLDYITKFDFYEELKSKYSNKFVSLIDELNEARRFSDILAMPSRSDRMKNICITEIDVEEHRRKPVSPPTKPINTGRNDAINKPTNGEGTVNEPPIKVKTIRNIAKSSIVPYQPVINNKEDIEKLLESMRTRLEKELEENGEFKLI